jgi:S1-C subfamily serine protease
LQNHSVRTKYIRALGVTLTLLLSIGPVRPSSAQQTRDADLSSLARAIEKARPSIVQIALVTHHAPPTTRAVTFDPIERFAMGTGVLIGTKGYVVTALHVVTAGRAAIERRANGSLRLEVAIPYRNVDDPARVSARDCFALVQFDEVDEDVVHDLALLKLKTNPFHAKIPALARVNGVEFDNLQVSSATLDIARPPDGAGVAISGFPLGESSLVTTAGSLASVWSSTQTESPVPLPSQDWSPPVQSDTYLADLAANPGNSGGPIYLSKTGNLIGICVAIRLAPMRDQNGNPVTVDGQQLSYASGLTVVVPARYIAELLDRNGVVWRDASKQ